MSGQSKTQHIRHSKGYCFKDRLERKYRQNELRKNGCRQHRNTNIQDDKNKKIKEMLDREI
jgi:hypothetical protein